MAKFKFYEDRKITAWTRDYFEVEAESLEDAISFIKKHDVSLNELDEENECTTYFVTYDDIKRGLEKAANGTFTIATRLGEDYVKGEKESARVSFNSFANEELDFDLIRADILMQIILFDEIIYD